MPKGMEAVLERTTEAGKGKKKSLKKAVLAKKVADKLAQGPGGKGPKGPKGPGMAVMIAIGAPKKGMGEKMGERMGEKTEDTPMRDGFQSRASSTEAILAKMEARIAALEAKLAEGESEGEGEEEEMGEEEGEYEDEEA